MVSTGERSGVSSDPLPLVYRVTFAFVVGSLALVVLVLSAVILFAWFVHLRWLPDWLVNLLDVVLALGIPFVVWRTVRSLSRRRYRFSLRSTMILTATLAAALSILEHQLRFAAREHRALQALWKDGSGAQYYLKSYEDSAWFCWLIKRFGHDPFAKATEVRVRTDRGIQTILDHRTEFADLAVVRFGTGVTDQGLRRTGEFNRFPNLRFADFRKSPLTDAGLKQAALGGRASAAPKATPEYWRTELGQVAESVASVRRGQTRVLCRSAGGREIYLVAYGPKQPRRDTANYNSACAGRDPASYARKDGSGRPVVLLLGPVHGGEVEGVAGLVNLVHIAETGKDLRGRAWPQLAKNVHHCRTLVIPLANPDGRLRFPYGSSVGTTLAERQRLEMGVDDQGTSYRWPEVKRLHPMRGPKVRQLGAYFNDDGINLMHDEWLAPMTGETRALLDLARDEAPDFAVSLHSCASAPVLLHPAYVPWTVKETITSFSVRLRERYAAAGLPHKKLGRPPEEDGRSFPPPSFNLTSALHHVCGAATMVHGCCNGVVDEPYPQVGHDELLDIELILFDELLQFAVENPVDWVR